MDREKSPKSTLEPLRPAASEILAQLDRILGSTPFRTSKRCSDLLSHVVHAACEGRLEFLKERTLGVEVFGRDPDYDTNQDPVVRNTAGQVRKRLAQFYMEPGRMRELRIELPPGAYLPQIYQPTTDVAKPAANQAISKPLVTRLRYGPLVALSAGILLLITLIVVVTTWHRPTDTDRFWAPILKQPGAIVMCVGQGHTYKLKAEFDKLFEAQRESSEVPSVAAGSIPLKDVVPTWDRYVGISDVKTLVRLTALFARFGKAVEFRGGRSTSLGDLRRRSTVLIGAFNNSWTLSLTGELRFYFDEDVQTNTYRVRDRQHPEQRSWEVRGGQQNTQDHEDYAIVSRVFDPTTEQSVMVAAGIQGGGTAAAGEFLTSDAYLGQALRNAPAQWEKRNLQFVLKTRLLGGSAGPPELIAAHYW